MSWTVLALATAMGATPPADAVVTRTRTFLDAYAANKVELVMGLLDPAGVAVYGSDQAEFCETADCVRQMMTDDFRLWRTARFGPMSKVSVRRGSDLASIHFEVPFSAAGGPEVPLRMSVTWRRVAGRWRVSQASNVVPTRGSSARQLLSAPTPPPR